MKPRWPSKLRADYVCLGLLLLYPVLPGVQFAGGLRLVWLEQVFSIGNALTDIFIFAILALGLNVVVGYAGLLHLGIAAFFGIGAYIVAILTYELYPFQFGFWTALALGVAGAGLAGLVLSAPLLRLRGDYLALVTLGFGEVVAGALKNLEEITQGARAIGPLPPPALPFEGALGAVGLAPQWGLDYRPYYYLALVFLIGVYLVLRNLARSRLGRAWVAIREDELAATCMGINASRVKLSALVWGAALAGLAGGLYATKMNSAIPDTFSFSTSIATVCCIILGGLASLRGTLLGVFLLKSFESILSPQINSLLQRVNDRDLFILDFGNWKFLIFGLTLILIMRFRPEGLLPSRRMQHELHQGG